jgi:hypothetical protein
LTKHPDWEKYGDDMWKHQELEDRPYIGLYRVVAEQMKKEQQTTEKAKDETLRATYINPFIDKLKQNRPQDFAKVLMQDYPLIYDVAEKRTLIPLHIQNEKGERFSYFFVFISETKEFYEWTYLKKEPLEGELWSYNSFLIDQLESVVPWNFTVRAVPDIFWDTYIVKKEKNEYLYLRKILL